MPSYDAEKALLADLGLKFYEILLTIRTHSVTLQNFYCNI